MSQETILFSDRIKSVIKDVPNFPKEGILFKDITPIFLDYELVKEIVNAFFERFKDQKIDAVICMESRGFWLGPLLAQVFKIPFIPVRKKGKLPGSVVSCTYDLEYGDACIEVSSDVIKKGWRVLVHDDVLATGGTACAACELVKMLEADVVGFAFLAELTFLKGKEKLEKYSDNYFTLIKY